MLMEIYDMQKLFPKLTAHIMRNMFPMTLVWTLNQEAKKMQEYAALPYTINSIYLREYIDTYKRVFNLED